MPKGGWISYTRLSREGQVREHGVVKVYAKQEPACLVRIIGQAPLQATVYELQRLRCNLCGERFTAEPPAGVGNEKYDETAKAIVALIKYGTGMPFYRLENFQQSLGVPLPAATQWDIVAGAAQPLRPVLAELVHVAAQGEILHNDDTSVRILSLIKENLKRDLACCEIKFWYSVRVRRKAERAGKRLRLRATCSLSRVVETP